MVEKGWLFSILQIAHIGDDHSQEELAKFWLHVRKES